MEDEKKVEGTNGGRKRVQKEKKEREKLVKNEM
jgi:hypothetical protein